MSVKFEHQFWGEGNKGFDVLLQNFRAEITCSKELQEFIRERAAVEDGYVKGLTKLAKHVSAVHPSSMGPLNPLWQALHTMCSKLATIHSQLVQLLSDIAREVSEYHIIQKEKMRSNMRGEIDGTHDSLRLLETLEVAVHKSKRLYTQSHDQVTKQHSKMEKVEPSSKARHQLEARMRQTETWMETMGEDHKQAIERHTQQVMAFQGNFVEACRKFETLEEEHLAQMMTFLIKMSQAQDNTHAQELKTYQNLNTQLDTNSVEKLLSVFVETKKTGTEKPVLDKFHLLSAPSVPTVLSAPAQEEGRPRSPSVEGQKDRAGKSERGLTFRFKKKLKISKGASDTPPSNGQVPARPQEPIPEVEVDEEGYSIRPEHATSIGGFPDEPKTRETEDSDSDFESEAESRLRSIRIKEVAGLKSEANVDDIKASVMSLRVGRHNSPNTGNIRKAASSQSLHNITPAITPPMERKAGNNSAGSFQGPTSLFLLDSDISLSPCVSIAEPLHPQPLVPATGHTEGALSLSKPLLPITVAPPTSEAPPTSQAPSTSGQTVHLFPENARPIPKPRKLPSSSTIATSSSELVKSFNQDGPVGEREKEEELLGDISFPSMEPTRFHSLPLPPSPSSSASGFHSLPLPPPSSSRATAASPEPQSADLVALTPPLPNVRRSARRRGSNPSSVEQAISPLALAQISAHVPTSETPSPVPPSTALSSPAQPPSTVTFSPSPSQPTTNLPLAPSPLQQASSAVVPLAVAFQETCNAIFKGKDTKDCIFKVTGEMVMSFPTSCIARLESCDQLRFKLTDADRVKQLLHNQVLLTRDETGFQFQFNMSSLSSYLRQMSEKQSAPFYNVQIIKYEVEIPDGNQLPVKLVSYWKCQPEITNFRLDYTYLSGNIPAAQKPLTDVNVVVPVNGGVKKMLSKPQGVWSGEREQLVWTLGEVAPEQATVKSLHAKFDVTEGPSTPQPVVIRFSCSGASLSGVDLELTSPAYRISLLKRKFSSGKYISEMKL